ncbi:MAG TPA: hypothetical protein VI112_07115 [Bacteroidia bacterium]|jgi:hypothetical protein
MKTFISFPCFFLFIIVASAQSKPQLSSDSLPASIKADLQKNFKKCKVISAVLGSGENGTKVYKVEAEEDHKDKILYYHLVYDYSGKLLKKEKEKQILYNDSPEDKKQPKHSGGGNPFPRY